MVWKAMEEGKKLITYPGDTDSENITALTAISAAV